MRTKTREPRRTWVGAPAWSLSIALLKLLNTFFWRVPLAERTRTERRWFLKGACPPFGARCGRKPSPLSPILTDFCDVALDQHGRADCRSGGVRKNRPHIDRNLFAIHPVTNSEDFNFQ